jgi:serine/threonine protein kinase
VISPGVEVNDSRGIALGTSAETVNVASFFNSIEKPTIFEYRFLRHIGHGSRGDVFLVLDLEAMEYRAAKVYDKQWLYRKSVTDPEPPIKRLEREVEIMSQLRHQNCMSLIEVLEDDATRSIILILPFADLGALSTQSWKADPISEEDAKFVFAQVARGIQHIHSLNIIHRDLKPDNILRFSDGLVQLADFSVSTQLSDENVMLDDSEGTPAFYSPEECSGDPYLGKPPDIWAFGMMIYVMIYGKLPFFDSDGEAVYFSQFFQVCQKIISGVFEFPESTPISTELRDLFDHVLDKNPKTRYTIDQVLQHPWLRNVPEFEPAPFDAGEEEVDDEADS